MKSRRGLRASPQRRDRRRCGLLTAGYGKRRKERLLDVEIFRLTPSRESERAVLRLLLETWNFGFETVVENRAAARFYLAHATERSTDAFAAWDSGRFVGAAFAGIPGRAPLGFSSASLEQARREFLKAVGEERLQYWLDEWLASSEMLLSKLPETSAAWLDLLMASPESRGRGVGRRLVGCVEAVVESAMPEPRLRLLTDTWCGWRFYERLGFQRRLERPFLNDDGEEEGAFFVYEKVGRSG